LGASRGVSCLVCWGAGRGDTHELAPGGMRCHPGMLTRCTGSRSQPCVACAAILCVGAMVASRGRVLGRACGAAPQPAARLMPI